MDQANKALKMEGVAHDRQHLLTLQSQFEALDMLSELHLPLSNLLQKNDIQFTLTAQLILDDIELYE